MVVFILEKVPVGLRGLLSRWMLEVKAGVFVGHCSAMVREQLWQQATGRSRGWSGVLMVHSADNEQGFAVRLFGQTSRLIEDFEGLQLVRIPS